MENNIKITEKGLTNVISESIKNVVGKIRPTAQLNEMARVGFIDGQLEVYVWTDDAGYIPHVHVRDTNSKGKDFETCIKLETNEYFLHGQYTDKMNSAQRNAFYDFMKEPCRNLKYQNNYELALEMWNLNNSNTIVTPHYDEYGHIIIPNYKIIK